jgi:hypothetical protein
MKRYLVLFGFVAFAALFLVANRGAYRGYFDGDDLDNISWGPLLSDGTVAKALFNPVLDENTNFRAAGQIMYVVLGRIAKLKFPAYIAWIHVVHLLTVVAIYFLVRKLGFERMQAAIATLVFGFNMAVFDIYWKPMYVFDLTCGLFCALTLLAWIYGRWLIALLCFWIAFKSKELAVMLPFVLALYEYMLGGKRWKRLVPFFAIALFLIIQAAVANHGRDNDYTFHFTVPAIWTSVNFYAPKLLVLILAIIIAMVSRDRRAFFGLAAFILLLAPLLFLPGRLFAAYLYVPLIGLAIAIAPLRSTAAIAALAAIWIPANFIWMRHQRVPLIAGQHESLRYAQTVTDFVAKHGRSEVYIFDRYPPDIHHWGAVALFRILAPDSKIYAVDNPEAARAARQPSVTLVRWYPEYKRAGIIARTPETRDAAYVQMGPDTPVWQLGDGWYSFEGNYRWIAPRATATVNRPPGARTFELNVLVGPQLIEADREIHVKVRANDQLLGTHTYVTHGWQAVSWPLKDNGSGPAQIEILVTPAYQGNSGGDHLLGIAVGGFGFK